MRCRKLLWALAAVLVSALVHHPLLAAKMQSWTDAEGKSFKAEAAGVVGPYALFRTSRRATVTVRLRALSPADCVRHYEESRSLPARAGDWAEAEARLSKEILVNAHVWQDGKIVHADLAGRPEPELFLVFFGWHDHSESWEALNEIRPVYERVRTNYPGVCEFLFFGVKHDQTKNRRMISEANMPWLVTDYGRQREFRIVPLFQPSEPPMAVILTRHGDVVSSSGRPVKGALARLLTELETLLVQMKPDSPRTAADRKHYLTAIQPVAFQTGKCAPILIASPLDENILREAGVERIDATIVVGEDHNVRDAQVSDNGGKLAPDLVTALADGLHKAIFVAGVENGRFVESTYEMHLNLAK